MESSDTNIPFSSARTGRPPTADEIEQAAALCWEDWLHDEEIAARLGIARRTLARWKHRADFQAAYAACQQDCEIALGRRISDREAR